jgi:hypothetical protein
MTASPAPMELAYAPHEKPRSRALVVLVAGLASTILALVGVLLLSHYADENIMGWYANYIIPAGAVLVGLVASSGYGLASWITGVKIRRKLLLTILLLQVLAYFAAQYVEFASMGPLVEKSTGKVLTFARYYHLNAVNFAWQEDNGKPGEPMGESGYFFRLLEIVGFVGGSLIVPGIMMKAPYCELCQVYMKKKRLAVLPACTTRKAKKKDPADVAALQAEQSALLDSAKRQMVHLTQLCEAADAEAFRQNVRTLDAGSKPAAKLPRRATLDLIHCRSCGTGYVQPAMETGKGNRVERVELPKTHLTREFVSAVLARPSGARENTTSMPPEPPVRGQGEAARRSP